MFSAPRDRAELGMVGAGAVTRCNSEGAPIATFSCNESDTFTKVLTPSWLWPWFACPPVRACLVWDLLPVAVRALCDAATWVSPQYMRLPMGCSHSVHILMQINLRYIETVLISSIKLQVNKKMRITRTTIASIADDSAHDVTELDFPYGVTDLQRWERQLERKHHDRQEAGFSVDEFADAVRTAKMSNARIMVVVIAFAGEHVQGDIQEFLQSFCATDHIKVLIVSIDLATDARWELAYLPSFHTLLSLTEQGFIDVWLGGPPSATVSAARHISGGPRPLRFHERFWGRADLRYHERERVREANILHLHFLALCEAASVRGGAHLWEHPEDRGRPDFHQF
jgi:hypothetical protein